MKEINYQTKEMPRADGVKIKKAITVAIAPAGHQFVGLNIEDLIRHQGFKSIKEAKKAGWRFQ